jgi:ABC-2 type transport system permease protein
MSKVGLIIKREYLSRVRKKSFLVMTFLGPLLFAGLLIGAIMLTMQDNTVYEVLIVDSNGVITTNDSTSNEIRPRFIDQFKDAGNIIYNFSHKGINPEDFKSSHYHVMIELDDLSINDGKCNFYFKKFPGEMIQRKIADDIEVSLERHRVIDELKLSYSAYKSAKVNVTFADVNVEKIGQEDRTQEKAVIGFAFAILIYMFIFMYGVQVMRGVIEEKTSRIVEVIVSSVKPFQLMMGKVVGIGLVGLTQFVMWVILSGIVAAVGISFFSGNIAGSAMVVENSQVIQTGTDQAQMMQQLMENEAIKWFFQINWPLMIFLFLFYFLGGYLLYASLFAAIGSAVDSETDTQQFMMPVSLPLVFGYVVASAMMSNPESSAGTFFAIFPLTSPVVMMVKATMDSTSWTLILVSMLTLVGTFLLFISLAGRIYRVGILMYGKKASYKELWKWIWYRP